MTERKAEAAGGDLTQRIEELGWFVPSARFFNLHINRTQDAGSVPEAIRRTISLPTLPVGWTTGYTRRFLKHLGLESAPACPADLREEILERERQGQPMVPGRVARQIALSRITVALHRRPREAGLNYTGAPGTAMLVRRGGESWVARAGDILTADDGTINFPVVVPFVSPNGSPIIITPCTEKYGVLVGRFQWLRAVDVGTRFRPGWSFVARPRASYRGADVLTLLRNLTLQHGIWESYAFERGVWKSRLVTECVKLLGSELDTKFSPHSGGKVFAEIGFHQDWTKLSAQFPTCDLGRFRGDTEATDRLMRDCQQGRSDPRRHFPTLASARAAFAAITREENETPVNTQWGRWVPAERWTEHTAARAMRRLPAELEFAFAPYAIEWTVRGHLIGGRVPIFEDLSVPFDFSAPWLYEFHGARIRVHFDPAAPNCLGTAVLVGAFAGRKAGAVLGSVKQVNETAGYVRMVMGWGEDDHTAGLHAKQAAARAMRADVRTITGDGRAGRAEAIQADGVGETASAVQDGPRAGRARSAALSRGGREASEFLLSAMEST